MPHQDTHGQVKQPRWAKCWEMWLTAAAQRRAYCAKDKNYRFEKAITLKTPPAPL
jgi:hypothetical protein